MTTQRKNHYEELIDAMMMEEVAGVDQDILDTLKDVDIDKKRLAILSILDNDRDLFLKIKRVVTENDVSKTEHIKNVVEMLREYVRVGEREQRKYGEVFTNYDFVNRLCDLVNPEDWSNPNMKFLDSCAGVGNFPAVIIERLMDGLKEWEPNEELRYTHIVENMLYICELQPKNAFLILTALDPQDIYELNVFNGSFLSKEFDEHMENAWGVDGFNYTIQNPPYQKEDGGHGASSAPLYNEFIDKSVEIAQKVISIHPSRWMAGGKGLTKFREKMFKRNDIKTIFHFDDSQEIFGKHVDIKGGIQYFIIDKSYSGPSNYNGIECKLGAFDVFVDPKFHSIIEKVKKNESLKSLFVDRGDNLMDIETNDKKFSDIKENNDFIKCFVSKQKGSFKFVNKHLIKYNQIIDSYKIITPRASGKGGDGFGKSYLSSPNETYSGTFFSFKTESKAEAESLMSYISTKFCNFLLSLRKNTHMINRGTLQWIPIVPLDREWNDEMLFEYFGLTKEEKELILNYESPLIKSVKSLLSEISKKRKK